MAHKEIWNDWAPIRWMPFIEVRTVAWCLDTVPGVPVDISTVETEWRFRRKP